MDGLAFPGVLLPETDPNPDPNSNSNSNPNPNPNPNPNTGELLETDGLGHGQAHSGALSASRGLSKL